MLAFILFPHLCEECGARRPDKTSLMQHKISHLQSANGPKIILVTKPTPPVIKPSAPPAQAVTFQDFLCGYCDKKTKGTVHNNYQHARACINSKRVAIICPYCPTRPFINFSAFKAHARQIHGAQFFPQLCVWCGKLCSSQFDFNHHVPKCIEDLTEDKRFQCEYCPTVFFCSDQATSTFFLAHMNRDHGHLLNAKWGDHFTCPRCKFILPGQASYQHHMNLCYQFGIIPRDNGIKSGFTEVLLEQNSRVGSSSRSATIESIKKKVCGLCSNSVSGKNDLSARVLWARA